MGAVALDIIGEVLSRDDARRALTDTDLGGNGSGGRRVVAGHHDDTDAGRLRLGDHLGDAVTYRVLEGEEPCEPEVPVRFATRPRSRRGARQPR